jgi:hypothetical protein
MRRHHLICRPLQLVLSAAAAALVLSGCVPFLADQQSARLVQPGRAEITPSFSYVSFSADGETEHVQNQFGLRLGYGLSQRTELRATYEHVSVVDVDDEGGFNMLGVGAKFGLVPDRVALYLPVGFVFGGEVDSGDTWTAVPTVLATVVSSNTFELTPSLKAFIPLTGDDREVFLGFHLGAGISNDLSRWAVRPEVGLVRNPGEEGTTWGWALGLSFRP